MGTLAKIDFRKFWNQVLERVQEEKGRKGMMECLKMGAAGSGFVRRKEMQPIRGGCASL